MGLWGLCAEVSASFERCKPVGKNDINLYTIVLQYMSAVIPARVEQKLIKKLDELVSTGYYVSRSDAVRDALRELLTKYEYVNLNVVYRIYAKVVASVLANLFRDKISDIVLYGSVVEGKGDEDSDIDLLILTRGEPFKLTFEIVSFIYPIELELNALFSINAYRKEDFVKAVQSGFLFEREIMKRGIPLFGGTINELRTAKTP